MEQVNSENQNLYNSSIEIGIRTLVLLNEFYPTQLDITQLVWFNHVVVHTEDFGGPQSLHPRLDDRAGELAVLRSLVQDGLIMMQRFNLIDSKNTHDGIFYTAAEESSPFINLMTSRYLMSLIEKAKWVANDFFALGEENIKKAIQAKIDMLRFGS